MADTATQEWDRSAYISIRRRRDLLLRPLSRVLAGSGVSASAISTVGVVLAAVTCWITDRSAPLALLAFLGALLCDALDGAVARQRGPLSSAGKVVDHACDTATFLLVLLAIARCGLASELQVAFSALLAVPLLVIAILARRRRSRTPRELSGGFLAHVYKAPIYVAFLAYTGGGADILEAAVKLANLTAGLSLILLISTMLRTPRASGAPVHAVPHPRN